MASIISSFNEAFSDDFAAIKFVLYSLPVYYMLTLYNQGDLNGTFFALAIFCSFLKLGLLTDAINNVRMSRTIVLTLNPLKWIRAAFLALVALVPNVLIFGGFAAILIFIATYFITQPVAALIISIIIYAVCYSIVATAYLSFAKHLNIIQAFRYDIILKSSADVLVSLLLFAILIAIFNVILIAPGYYVAYLLKIPYTHWVLTWYLSVVVIANISITANYLSQVASEQIEESNQSYDENVNVNDVIDNISERMS